MLWYFLSGGKRVIVCALCGESFCVRCDAEGRFVLRSWGPVSGHGQLVRAEVVLICTRGTFALSRRTPYYFSLILSHLSLQTLIRDLEVRPERIIIFLSLSFLTHCHSISIDMSVSRLRFSTARSLLCSARAPVAPIRRPGLGTEGRTDMLKSEGLLAEQLAWRGVSKTDSQSCSQREAEGGGVERK